MPEAHHLCPCGDRLPEPLERVGNRRALCRCGQVARLDPAAQAAYAERAPADGQPSPSPAEPPRAAAPEPANEDSERVPAPAEEPSSDSSRPAGEPTGWSDAERTAPAQLPEVEEEAQVEAEAPAPPAPRPAGDFGSWMAG